MQLRTKTMIHNFVPSVYRDVKEFSGLPYATDMSRSNLCHLLTLALYNRMHAQQFPARRELHQNINGLWHFVIAHAETTAPSESDIITDLNPWQFGAESSYTGPLHGPRRDVMDSIKDAGAPSWFVALRSVQTLKNSHTLANNPYVR